jgi:hypothetical protein
VLRGMEQFLRQKRCEHLIVEVNDAKLQEMGSSAGAVVQWLFERDYQVHRIGLLGPKKLGSVDSIGEVNLHASPFRAP